MNRISGPAGLPHSCAEMVRPSGVFTVIGLYFTSCPKPGCAIVKTKAATAVILTRRRFQTKFVIEILPLFFCCGSGYHARSEGEKPDRRAQIGLASAKGGSCAGKIRSPFNRPRTSLVAEPS